MPPRLAAVLAPLLALAACGDGSSPASSAAPSISARELLDARDAIEKLLASERTAEALIVARKLVEKAPEGSEAALKANEVASRALFTHARLCRSHILKEKVQLFDALLTTRFITPQVGQLLADLA